MGTALALLCVSGKVVVGSLAENDASFFHLSEVELPKYCFMYSQFLYLWHYTETAPIAIGMAEEWLIYTFLGCLSLTILTDISEKNSK